MSDMPDVYVDGTSYAYITPPDWPSVRYIRGDIVAAKDAEIERLKKVADQAIALANIRLEYRAAHDDPEGDNYPYVCCDSCGTPFLSALAAYLKEKENAN